MFGALSLWTHFVVRGRRIARVVPVALLLPMTAALAEELLQAASAHRSADPIDFACDVAGMLACWRIGEWMTRAGAADSPTVRPRSASV